MKNPFSFLNKNLKKKEEDNIKIKNIATAGDAYNIFWDAYQAYEKNLDRCIREWELYGGIENSQYPKDVIAKLKEDNRNLFQANFIRKKVDGLVGYILKNSWEFGFENVDKASDPIIDKFKKLLKSDQELLDWDYHFLQAVRDGVINFGIEQMYIDTDYDVFGRIGFKRLDPRTVILDPQWVDISSKTLRNVWVVGYLTIDEISEKYKISKETIDELINYIKFEKTNSSTGIIDDLNKDQIGSLYRVIEWHKLDRVKKKFLVSAKTGEIIIDYDEKLKKEYIDKNNIKDEDIVEIEKYVNEYRVVTFAPELENMLLQSKVSNIQIGRLPFFVWSFCRINGINTGLPSLLESLQVTFNVRQGEIDSFISDSLFGNLLVDPALFDDSLKLKQFVDNYNKPYQCFVTSPNSLSSGRKYIERLRNTQDLYNIFREQTDILNLTDRISKQPLVLEGMSEGSEETGILYARKEARAISILYTMFKEIEGYIAEKGEAWFELAKNLYSDVVRKIYLNKESIDIKLEKNDLINISRTKVNVIKSPKSQSVREFEREIYFEILSKIGNALPTITPMLIYNIINTLNIDAKDAEKLKKACEVEINSAMARMQTSLSEMSVKKTELALTQIQLETQLAAIMNQLKQLKNNQPQVQPQQLEQPAQPEQLINNEQINQVEQTQPEQQQPQQTQNINVIQGG